MERPFGYVESSLLGGRTFRGLGHLNETTAWWLAEVADVRVHRQTKARPIDRHAEERTHLVPLPARPFDVVQMVRSCECHIVQPASLFSRLFAAVALVNAFISVAIATAYLYSSAVVLGLTGKTFFVQGGRVALFQGWTMTETIEKDDLVALLDEPRHHVAPHVAAASISPR